MPDIKKITLPNGVTYDLCDEVARATAAVGFSLIVVESLPAASASTKGAIYLVPHTHEGDDDTYDEYVTVEQGSETKTYSWEKIGNTDIDLSTQSDTFVKTVSKTTSKLVTTTVPNVTGNTEVTASKVTMGTAFSVPNVTNAGSASTWNFSVADETLVIGGGNGTKPTLGTAFSIPNVTAATDVTATNTTLGTEKTVATGDLADDGTGAAIVTDAGIGTTGPAIIKIGK